MLLLTVVSHVVLATVFVPVNSDLTVYKRYTAAVAKAVDDGTGFSVARDRNIRDRAIREGRPEPDGDVLLVEYPPLAVTWMAIAGIGLDLDAQPDAYDPRYRLAMLALDLLVILVIVRWAAGALLPNRGNGASAAWRLAVYGAAGLILGNLLFDRLDLVVGALLLGGVLALARGWWPVAFLLLAVAINIKAAPLALAPLWVIASLPPGLLASARARPAPLLVALIGRSFALAGLAVAIFLPFVVTEGARSLDFLNFRALQGVQIESVPAAFLLVLGAFGLPVEVTATLGTFELQTALSSSLAAISPAVLLIGAAGVVVLYARTWLGRSHPEDAPSDGPVQSAEPSSVAASDPSRFLTATVATLLLTLVTSKLLSPQYLLWIVTLVPFLDFGRWSTRAFQRWFLVTCLVTTAIFPYLLGRTLVRQDPAGDGYLDPTPLGVVLLVLRNGLLVWLAWLAIRPLLGRFGRFGPSAPLS